MVAPPKYTLNGKELQLKALQVLRLLVLTQQVRIQKLQLH